MRNKWKDTPTYRQETIREHRLRKLDPDAPIPPAGLRPQQGVEYGCGAWTCADCYEPDVDDDQRRDDGSVAAGGAR